MKTRMIINPSFAIKARCGAVSWYMMGRFKQIFKEMFLAKTE